MVRVQVTSLVVVDSLSPVDRLATQSGCVKTCMHLDVEVLCLVTIMTSAAIPSRTTAIHVQTR
jgi:hypothetical protein